MDGREPPSLPDTASAMIRPLPAMLLLLATIALPAAGQPAAEADFRFSPAQEAAVRRLEARLVDGDTARQVHTEGHATRLCYRAALAQGVPPDAARDRNGLAARQRAFFADCVGHAGYRLR